MAITIPNRRVICFSGHRDKVVEEIEIAKIEAAYPDSRWIHGGAKEGFDAQVHQHILRNNIPFRVYRPQFKLFPDNPKYAPIDRNHKMVEDCDLLVVCYDGRVEGGTYDTVKYAKSLSVKIIYLEPKGVTDAT